MKLSPPASSSDLDTAREIARRLHQRRRREDRPDQDHEAPAPGPALGAAPALRPHTPAPIAPPPALDPPSWDEPATETAPTEGAALDPLAAFGEPTAAEDEGDEGVPDIEAEEPGVSPEELVGAPEPPFEDGPQPSAYDAVPLSPFDVDLDETEAPAEELPEAPAPPSWDDIVETCLGLAEAGGAMLVDPAGQVFAARGDWPAPGPDAIAAKLVTTMERTLKDAPTRSISAPLVGKHLTAWRVPLTEGLVTAAFIGDSPVRAEARPSIDTEIHRGAGA